MKYVLSVADRAGTDRHFQTVAEALAFYASLQAGADAGTGLTGREQLRCAQRNTFVTLFPGISVEMAASELETVWEWAADDPLKIRPVLKERYRAKPR